MDLNVRAFRTVYEASAGRSRAVSIGSERLKKIARKASAAS